MLRILAWLYIFDRKKEGEYFYWRNCGVDGQHLTQMAFSEGPDMHSLNASSTYYCYHKTCNFLKRKIDSPRLLATSKLALIVGIKAAIMLFWFHDYRLSEAIISN